jgi:hypothetical protein
MINRVKWQLVFTLFWFGSAYLATGALLSWEWAWRCAWLNAGSENKPPPAAGPYAGVPDLSQTHSANR